VWQTLQALALSEFTRPCFSANSPEPSPRELLWHTPQLPIDWTEVWYCTDWALSEAWRLGTIAWGLPWQPAQLTPPWPFASR